jgi:hypothetical protein
LSSKDAIAWEIPKVVQFLREVKHPDGTTLLGNLGSQTGLE